MELDVNELLTGVLRYWFGYYVREHATGGGFWIEKYGQIISRHVGTLEQVKEIIAYEGTRRNEHRLRRDH